MSIEKLAKTVASRHLIARRFDQSNVDQLKRDFRRLTKIYRAIPHEYTEEAQRQAQEALEIFERFEDSLNRLVNQQLPIKKDMKSSPGGLASMVMEHKNDLNWFILKAFPRQRGNYDSVDLNYLHNEREKHVRRMQKAFRKLYKALESYLETEGGGVEQEEAESVYQVAGTTIVIDNTTQRSFGDPALAKKLQEQLVGQIETSLKAIQKAGFGKALPNLKIFVRFDSRGETVATYNRDADTVTLYSFSLKEYGRGLHGTLIHEIGHRYYYRVLSPRARDYYNQVIGQAKIPLTDLHVQRYLDNVHYRQDGSIERTKERKYEALNAYRHVMDSIDIAAMQWLIEEGTEDAPLEYRRLLPNQEVPIDQQIALKRYMMTHVGREIPFEYITQYGNTEPVEAFAESFRLYVTRGPRALQRFVREVFERVTRQGRTASMKTAENKPTDEKLWEKVQELVQGERKELTHNGETVKGPNDGEGFKKFPSAYANGWAVKVYNDLGGDWKSVESTTHLAARPIPLDRRLVDQIMRDLENVLPRIFRGDNDTTPPPLGLKVQVGEYEIEGLSGQTYPLEVHLKTGAWKSRSTIGVIGGVYRGELQRWSDGTNKLYILLNHNSTWNLIRNSMKGLRSVVVHELTHARDDYESLGLLDLDPQLDEEQRIQMYCYEETMSKKAFNRHDHVHMHRYYYGDMTWSEHMERIQEALSYAQNTLNERVAREALGALVRDIEVLRALDDTIRELVATEDLMQLEATVRHARQYANPAHLGLLRDVSSAIENMQTPAMAEEVYILDFSARPDIPTPDLLDEEQVSRLSDRMGAKPGPDPDKGDGLNTWFSGHGGENGDAEMGDWVSIAPKKKTIEKDNGDKKTFEPGDIVGPCGDPEGDWSDVTNDGSDPLKCMPRDKAHDMSKKERAELAKEKMKAEKEEGESQKPTYTRTLKDED